MRGAMAIALWGLATTLQAAVQDVKCYVQLQDGQKVVLQGTVPQGSDPVAQFMRRGREMNGQIVKVREVIECRPSGLPFEHPAAREQEQRQPR